MFNSHLITNHAIVRDCIRSVADFCFDHSGKRADGGGQEQAKEGKQIEGDLGEDSSEDI